MPDNKEESGGIKCGSVALIQGINHYLNIADYWNGMPYYIQHYCVTHNPFIEVGGGNNARDTRIRYIILKKYIILKISIKKKLANLTVH